MNNGLVLLCPGIFGWIIYAQMSGIVRPWMKGKVQKYEQMFKRYKREFRSSWKSTPDFRQV